MTDPAPRTDDYLEHIAEAIERIFNYVDAIDETAFLQNRLVQDAVIRNLEVIGEASRNIAKRDPSFADAHPHLQLQAAYEMRNALAHGYFRINMEIVWRTIHEDLPALHAAAKVLLDRGAS